jgi:hypothetical protein
VTIWTEWRNPKTSLYRVWSQFICTRFTRGQTHIFKNIKIIFIKSAWDFFTINF